MMGFTDMSTPITRGELQEVLSQVKQEHQRDLREATAPLATKAELQAAIAPLATKAELEMWGGALVARIQQGEQRTGNLERGQEQLIGLVQQTQQQIQQSERRFSESLQQTEHRLLAELARHTSAIHEAMRTEIKACFEPLADLPGRMSRVEAVVFGPKPGARRTRRRSS